MAERVESFSVSVPAGTLSTAPQLTSIGFAPGEIERVEIMVPSGHAGLTGFQLALGAQPIIPFTAGAFIVADGETLNWPLEGYPNSGAWQCRAFNTDVYAHSFHFRFLLREIRLAPASLFPVVAPLPL